MIGTIILWVSWLFFNGGSTLDMFQPRVNGTPKIMMNTILAGATGGLATVAVKSILDQKQPHAQTMKYDIQALCNGVLSGLVSITGACNNVDPWQAFLIGLIGALVYIGGVKLCVKLRVDDPIEASSVHGFCGMWGLIAVGLFDNTNGLFCGSNRENAGAFFGWQLLGMLVICLWCGVTSAIYFFALRKFDKLRVSITEEVLGLDIAEMDMD